MADTYNHGIRSTRDPVRSPLSMHGMGDRLRTFNVVYFFWLGIGSKLPVSEHTIGKVVVTNREVRGANECARIGNNSRTRLVRVNTVSRNEKD